jgi:hypothetical protein
MHTRPRAEWVFPPLVSSRAFYRFVACLRGQEQPIPTAEHALHVLEIILKATQSASEGGAIGMELGF